MFCHPTLHKSGLATILLVLLLALPGTAMSEGGGGEDDGEASRRSVLNELQDIQSEKKALEKELKLLSGIDLDGEMSEFIDKKKTEARIEELKSEISTLSSDEDAFTVRLDRITKENWNKIYLYIQYFTIQTYLGFPPLYGDVILFQDPLALGAFQIVMMSAALDPFFRAYFEARYGYLFEE